MKTTRNLCVKALGIALFVVLTMCLQVPVFENYYLCLGYVVMAMYCYSLGPIKGAAVGFFGVVLYCLLTSGLRGMPGWAVGNIVIGTALGLTCKATEGMKSKLIRHIIICCSIIISTAIAMLGVKSIIECFLYAQPFLLRTANNIYAFIADVVVLIISIPICYKLHPLAEKTCKMKEKNGIMIDTEMTNKAMEIVRKARKRQSGESGLSRMVHPSSVALQMKDENTRVVALLHDVVENTDITFEDLRKEGVSEQVIEALKALVFDETAPLEHPDKFYNFYNKLSEDEKRKHRRSEYMDRLLKNDIASIVKLCELEQNRRITRFDEITDKDRTEEYYEWIRLKRANIKRHGNHNYDEIFPIHSWNRHHLGRVVIFFEGVLRGVFRPENKYDAVNQYEQLKSIFEASVLFEKMNIDEGSRWVSYLWCSKPTSDSGYSCFKSDNGAISLEFDNVDDFDPFNCTADEEEWITHTCLSNVEEGFINDIVSALETYFGFKVFYRVKSNNCDFPTIIFSDAEIGENEK